MKAKSTTKPTNKQVVAEFGKTHNILKTAKALNISWYQAFTTLKAEGVDLYHRGKGVRMLAA